MYLNREAIMPTVRQIANLAADSTFAMTFQLPLNLIEPEERPSREATEKFARMAGTPFISLFSIKKCCNWPTKQVFEKPSTYPQAI